VFGGSSSNITRLLLGCAALLSASLLLTQQAGFTTFTVAGPSAVLLSHGQPLSTQMQLHATLPMASAQHVAVRVGKPRHQTQSNSASWVYFGSVLAAWALLGSASRRRSSHGQRVIACSRVAVNFSEPLLSACPQDVTAAQKVPEAATAAAVPRPEVSACNHVVPSGMTEVQEPGPCLLPADARPRGGIRRLTPALSTAGVRHARYQSTSGRFTGHSSRGAQRAANRHVGASLKAVHHQAVTLRPSFDPSKVRSKLQYGLSIPRQITGTGSRAATAQVSITRQSVRCGGVLAESVGHVDKEEPFQNLHSSEFASSLRLQHGELR